MAIVIVFHAFNIIIFQIIHQVLPARQANETLHCRQIVPEHYCGLWLTDTGMPTRQCQFCNAQHLSMERPSICCNNGAIHLPLFPDPPQHIRQVWEGESTNGRLYRQHARSINNALTMA